MKLLLHPDKWKVNGPNVDNGMTTTIYTGEHERQIIAELLAEDPEAPMVVIVLTGKDAEEVEHGS